MNISRRLLFSIGAIAIAVFVLLWLSSLLHGTMIHVSRELNAPYGRFYLFSRAAWEDLRRLFNDSVEIRSVNKELEKKLESLQTEILLLHRLKEENDTLRDALGITKASKSLVYAEIVSRGGGSGWWRTLRINKGKAHGIELNCPVVTPEGLAGRVIELTSTTADILLLTDVNSSVSCVIEGVEHGARGILSGGGILARENKFELLHVVEPMNIAYLEKDAVINEGMRVLTSGLGGVYPFGIPVGIIVSVNTDASGLFQRAHVAPFVDFAAIRRVFVLTEAIE